MRYKQTEDTDFDAYCVVVVALVSRLLYFHPLSIAIDHCLNPNLRRLNPPVSMKQCAPRNFWVSLPPGVTEVKSAEAIFHGFAGRSFAKTNHLLAPSAMH